LLKCKSCGERPPLKSNAGIVEELARIASYLESLRTALLAWLVLSSLVWYFGEWLGEGLFPLLKAVIMAMSADMSPSLKLMKPAAQLDYALELSVWLLRPAYLNVGQFIPAGTELKSSAHLLHALIPLAIEMSILWVWPVLRNGRTLAIGDYNRVVLYPITARATARLSVRAPTSKPVNFYRLAGMTPVIRSRFGSNYALLLTLPMTGIGKPKLISQCLLWVETVR
jgi:hypothetical protein